MVYYSKETNGFYHEARDLSTMPDDIIEISDELHRALFSSGLPIKCGDDGLPMNYEHAPATDEQLRSGMVIPKIKAMQNLKKVGKLKLVLGFMGAEPRDSDIRILWEYSENFHRTDPTLIDFCINKMGLDDEGIDNLFL